MTASNRLSDLGLASLIGSRICHDLISPVGAIANGLEVLETSTDEEMRKVALDLIGNSARQAARKLAFARLAFGAAGSMGSDISLGDAQDIAEEFLKEDKRVTLNWRAPRENRPKVIVKLLLNMLLLGISCIPRGGEVIVDVKGDALLVEAKGPRAAFPEKTAKVLTGEMPAADVDAHMVQPYYTLLLLEESGCGMDIDQGEDTVLLRAAP
jgi:histidine phosphotransferase ChpT